MKWVVWFLAGAAASGQEARITAPKIWDDKALEDWAAPIAALGVRPSHYTSAEYYAIPADNLRSYPIYRPDREPSGYWEWLQKQKPEPLVDASKMLTREDWVRAGETAFRTLPGMASRSGNPQRIAAMRDPKTFAGLYIQPDGSLLMERWVVTTNGVETAVAACAFCHVGVRRDGSVQWGTMRSRPPEGLRDFIVFPPMRGTAMDLWRSFTVPWAPDERIERLREPGGLERYQALTSGSGVIGTAARNHSSPFYTTKTPDLNHLKYNRYIDATGTHRLRSPEDVARYVAFVSGADPMEFGSYKILQPGQRRIPFRYADEVLYAIGMHLMSLEPPKNPQTSPDAVIARGGEIFRRETCINCHVPPDYTSGKLTLANGYTPPADHPFASDILKISVGTDDGLATKTRKGTGFYKIPSLRGVWYRDLLLHDGSVASLEEMFDPTRLRPDHVPGGWKGPGVTKRAIPGHPFGLGLDAEDKAALLAFLRSL